MAPSQPAVPSTANRLVEFNRQRDALVQQIHQRIVKRSLAAAERGGDHSLEYVLNDVASNEMRRLEKASDRKQQRQFQRWRDLANRLLSMSEADKRAELDALVGYYCRDIVGNFDTRVYRFATNVLPPAMSFLLSPVANWRDGLAALQQSSQSVEVQGPLEQIRTLSERATLVFTPTHSSNLDSIVVAWGLLVSGLPPVTYGAGKNLFSNPFISYFMRNLGAYRVDRRLRFPLYKEVLKEYSTVLLEHGYHSLFFPGGTRCRSNMVESRLKLGLLGTALTAYVNNLCAGRADRRIFVVPVTINYRLVLEAETLIDDYLAETGRSRYIIQDDEFSRLGRIVEFARKTMVHEGALHLSFGQPVDIFGNRVDGEGRSRDARGRIVDPAGYVTDRNNQIVHDNQRDSAYTRRLGKILAADYRRLTVFLPTHIVARALMDELSIQARERDIYRLLRCGQDARTIAIQRLRTGVDRLCERIRQDPTLGSLHPRSARATVTEIVDDALRGMVTYHTHPVARRHENQVHIEDIKLLFYYQNRLSHIPVEPPRAGAQWRAGGQ